MNFIPWDGLNDIRVTVHRKTFSPDTFDLPTDKQKRSCRFIFRQLKYMMNNQNLSDMGPSSIQNRELPEDYQPMELVGLVSRTLKYWESTGFYSKENIEYLKKVDESLPPMRTHYVEIVHKQAVASIRIFDGSSDVWSGPLPWYGVRGQEQMLTPIERNYSVLFAERSPQHHSYILELGLLGSPKIFQNGVDSVFSNVAQWVDSTYNNMNFRTFGDVTLLRQRNLQIYALSRPKLVPYYEKLGLKPVMSSSTEGSKPYTFPDGMVLLRMSGEDMLRWHFHKEMFPTMDGHQPQFGRVLSYQKSWQRNRELEEAPAWQDVTTMQDFWQVWDNIVAKYWGEMQNTTTNSRAHEEAYQNLVMYLYQLYKSPVYYQHTHPAEAALKMATLKQLLTMSSEQGWGLAGSHIIQLEHVRRFPESYQWQTVGD